MFNFRRREKFLLLDVSPEKISGLLISLDDQKKIRKEKSWEDFGSGSKTRNLPVIFPANKVIVACDTELAFKVFIPVSVKRKAGAGPLERSELENLMAQAIGKVFNNYRKEASLVLGTDELDAILAGSNISGFEVDGHKVINPLGFEPEEMRAVMEMTFTSRKTFERVRSVIKKANFFFTEKSHAQAATIKKVGGRRADFLAIGYDRSYIYAGNGFEICRARKELKWSTGRLVAEISRHWDLSENTARGIYGYYFKNGVSPSLEKYFGKIFSKPIGELAKQVKKIKTTAKVCFTGDVPQDLVGRSVFFGLPLKNFAEKSGFTISDSTRLSAFGADDFSSDYQTFQQLAPFFEFYYDNSDSEINGWLKRRLHWLGSAV